MVTIKQKFSPLPNGDIDINAWLQHFGTYKQIKDLTLIQKAINFAQQGSLGLTTFYGQPCLEQGLEMADLLLEMQLDKDTIAAAIIIGATRQIQLDSEAVLSNLNASVANIIKNVLKMDILDNLEAQNSIQINLLRKAFLAMTGDIRAVLIRLAERTCVMRRIKHINPAKRAIIARETMDIYAPLANRLGIGQIKWELEDNAFHFLHPETYSEIAEFLAEKRIIREKRIKEIISKVDIELKKLNLKAKIYGRAKHIYSIYLKTQRKNTNYNNIFDCSAIRILVENIEQCYTVLSIVHELFYHIPQEFDDYIAYPKPNGYRSIHTAVTDNSDNIFEIQIRTNQMHEEAEHGIAAHWMYKEPENVAKKQENRIRFLRQLIAWKGDITHDLPTSDNAIHDNMVYVFTPKGELINLPQGATPLDFAYRVHTEIGHRCKGAKIAGNIVPLTRQLQTGDTIEIITASNTNPSRDWLNRQEGYLKTRRARAKVANWLRSQNIITDRSNASNKHEAPKKPIPNLRKKTEPTQPNKKIKPPPIAYINDFLTRVALCCNPSIQDKITGYITKTRGISIHKTSCKNIASLIENDSNRIIPINWETQKK